MHTCAHARTHVHTQKWESECGMHTHPHPSRDNLPFGLQLHSPLLSTVRLTVTKAESWGWKNNHFVTELGKGCPDLSSFRYSHTLSEKRCVCVCVWLLNVDMNRHERTALYKNYYLLLLNFGPWSFALSLTREFWLCFIHFQSVEAQVAVNVA